MSRKNPPPIDRRAHRTRSALADALIELGAAQGIDAVEVGALVQKAGVGRSTFYAHYADKDDFLLRSFANMIGLCEAADARRDPGRSELLPARPLLAHAASAGDFARAAFASSRSGALMAAGEAKLRAIAETNLAALKPDWDVKRRRETAVFLAGGLMGLMCWQIETTQAPETTVAAYAEMARRVLGE